MKKTYYPQNLITTVSNQRLKSTFKEYGNALSQFVVELEFSPFDDTSTVYGRFNDVKEDIVNLILPFLKSISGVDPLLVLSINYLYRNAQTNEISKIDKESHPFYNLFEVEVYEITETELGTSQEFDINTNIDRLRQFLIDYVFVNNPDYVTDTLVFNFNYLFIDAVKTLLDESISTGVAYTYDHYKINRHSTKNLSYLDSSNLIYDFESEYNFYLKPYENLFTSSANPEPIMPNYYATNTYLNADEPERISSFVSLTGSINVTEENILSTQYFLDYAQTIKSLSTTDRRGLPTIKNYIIDSYFANKSNNALSSENFPYTAKITFSNFQIDSLSDLAEQKKLDTLFANNAHFWMYNTTSSATQNFYLSQEIFVKTPSDTGEYVDNDGTTYTLSTENVFASESVASIAVDNLIDFKVFGTGSDVGFAVYNSPNLKFYSEENRRNLQFLKKPVSIFSYIHLNNLLARIRKNRFDYLNVVNFQTLDVYPMCYQIEKLSNNIAINKITIARNASNTEISFYDTQLTYDKPYNYKVYSVDLINGFTYQFSDTDRNYITNVVKGKINFFDNTKSYKNLIIDEEFEIYDDPPTTVDVNIVPFLNRPNSMLFLLNTQSTSLLEEPKIINQSEKQNFFKIRKKQKLNSKKVYFETVEDLSSVQVYRTTKPPKKYSDFFNSFYTSQTFENSTSTSFIDTIQQNVDYYYMFRSVDVHNNLSNPSEIFKVRITNNDGAIYPIISIYNIEQQEISFDYQKSFKKYININPSIIFTQLLVNDDGTVSLGADSDIWNQKFKFRIKSKKSGKSFDVNLTFKKIIENLVDETDTL